MQSPAGELLRRAAQLDAAVSASFAVNWMDLSIEEVKALEVIREERDRYRREQEATQGQDQLIRQAQGIPITHGR
jgi:hypothetical protein